MEGIHEKEQENKIEKTIELILLILGVLLIIYLRILWMNYHYYVNGVPLWDAGWFAHLISNPSIKLINPNVILSNSYYDTHLSPALALYSILSPFKSFSIATQLGIFIGICSSLSFPLIYIALKNNFKLKGRYLSLFSIYIFSWIFTALSEPERLVQFPHFEVIIITIIGYSLLFFSRKSYKLTWIFLIFALSFREDAGFHFGFIYLVLYLYFILYLSKFKFGKETYKEYKAFSLKLSLTGFLCSIILSFIRNIFFINDNAFIRVYSGENFYSHLNIEFIKNNLNQFFNTQLIESFWLLVPISIALILFLKTRNVIYILGFISCIPWLLINLTAVSPVASRLQAHYGFPFLIGILFPIIIINSPIDKNKLILNQKYIVFCFLIISAIILSLNINYLKNNFIPLSSKYINSTNIALEKVSLNSQFLKDNNILISIPIVSFLPDKFEHKNVATYKKLEPEDVNGIIYLKDSYIQENLKSYFNIVFPQYPKNTVKCLLYKDSNIYGLFRKEYFKDIKFICTNKEN